MCTRSQPTGPSAVGARHVKERPHPAKLQPYYGLRVIPRGSRELGACTAGPTHPSSGTACQSTSSPYRQNRYRMRAADAHASSHMQVRGGPRAPPSPASSSPAGLGVPNIAH